MTELSGQAKEEIEALKEPQRSRVQGKVGRALEFGMAQCPDCTRIFGIWKLQARTVKDHETGRKKTVCHICANDYREAVKR